MDEVIDGSTLSKHSRWRFTLACVIPMEHEDRWHAGAAIEGR